MLRLLALTVAVCVSSIANAHSLDQRINPTLPPFIKTVEAAARYYMGRSGYALQLSTPRTGDYRYLSATRVDPDTISLTPLSIRDALTRLVPEADIYVFETGRMIAFGPKQTLVDASIVAPADLAAPLAEPLPQVAKSTPAVTAEPAVRSDDLLPPAPSTQIAASVEPAPPATTVTAESIPELTSLPVVEATPEPTVHLFQARRGEWLKDSLERASREAGYDLIWVGRTNFPFMADATFSGPSFPQAAAKALAGTWQLNAPLVLSEAPNNVLVIHSP